MLTETLISTREMHHHFIQVKGNELELDKLDRILLAYDRFELDGAVHSHKFTLSKTLMKEANAQLSSPADGSTWKILKGRITNLPDVSERDTALILCHRLENCGIEKFVTEGI